MSSTSLMTLVGILVMLGAWYIIGQRVKASASGVSQQIKLMRVFFLFMGLFCLCIFAPQLALSFAPDTFPAAMAWGYIVGHCFLYVALTSMLMLTFSMVPRLANKQAVAGAIGLSLGILITVLSIVTMGFGVQPEYDYERSVILLNVAPIVGALIGIFATGSVFPAAALMIRNGIHNPTARARSFLIGGGLFIIMTAGPLHDVARTWQVYMAADVVSMLGFIVLSVGVLYRFEQRLVPLTSMQKASSAV